MTDAAFDIYKLLVEEVRDAKRARRELSNTFMTLNLGGVGALGFLARGDVLNPTLFVMCAFALVLTCIIWRTSNRYYTLLLDAKYKSIYAIEDGLPHHPIRDEYDALKAKRQGMKWFTLERAMPLLFILGYVLFVIVQLGVVDIAGLIGHAHNSFRHWLHSL
jgi:hypothetical protein